ESLAFSGIQNPTTLRKRQHFMAYLTCGGFPRVVLEPKEEQKIELLKNYYETIYLKDIIFPNSIRSASDLYDVLYFLIANTGSPLSYNRIADTLHISPETVREYIGYAEDAFLFYPIKKFDYSVKKQLANPKKIYCIDTGIVSAVAFAFSQNRGRLLENAVFLALKKNFAGVYYHKDRYECDFLVQKDKKIRSAIQVTESLRNPDTRARELRGLHEAMEAYGLTEGTIVTLQESGEVEDEAGLVRIVPVTDWLESLRAGSR
ncbi:MAG TPA: ATP-binding protein, partial [Methanoregula sp.]|nr:ATP-binding protein [Methanoregula sp.]